MTLRDEAITHMAQSQFGAGWWDSVAGEHDRNDALKIAAEHLDALLDYLDAHTEEWADAAQPDNDRVHYEGVAAELIRGLR